jgi:hypothetical protein
MKNYDFLIFYLFIYYLKQQVIEKEQIIDNLHDSLREKTIENENLRKLLK